MSKHATKGDAQYGWKREVRLAFRRYAGDPGPEFCLPFVFGGEIPDDLPVIARWPDGDFWQVPDITVRDTKKPNANESEPLWKGQHKGTHNKLCLVQKPDRNLLLVLEEQSRSVCQIRVDKFGELPGPQPARVQLDVASLQGCLAFMTAIAILYEGDEIERSQLYNLRDRMLQERDIHLAANGEPTNRGGYL